MMEPSSADGHEEVDEASGAIRPPRVDDGFGDTSSLTDAVEALRASEERFRLLLDSAAEAIYGLDTLGNCTFANRACLRMLGYDRVEELIGRNMHDLIHHTMPDGSPYPEADCPIFKAFLKGEPIHLDDEVLWRKDGSSFAAEYWSHPVARDGEVVGAVVSFLDITARKHVDEALRHERDLVQTIAETSTSALVMTDTRGYCAYANGAFLEMTGYSAEEIRSKPLHELVHHHLPDGRPYPIEDCPINRALPEEVHIRAHEDLFFRSDGSSFPVLCAASPIYRDGRPVWTVIEIRDITAEKEAAQTLQSSEKRFRMLADTAPAILWVTDPKHHTTFLSRGWHEYTGQGEDESLGLGWLQAVHPDDRQETERLFLEAAGKRQPVTLDFRLRRRDGEYRWVLDEGRPRHDDDGQWCGYVGSVIDVHDRKLATEVIRLEEERYRLVTRATNEVIWDWDLETDRLEWNDALEEHFGYSREDIGSTIHGWSERIHPEEREYVISQMHAALESDRETWSGEYRFRKKDGSYAICIDRSYIARDGDGRPYRMIGSMLDLTERKRAEEDLHLAVQRFETVADMIPQFVWSTRPDGYHDYFNERWYEYTGMPREGDQGWNWKDYLHPDDVESSLETWHHSLETGEPYEVHYRFRRASDGVHRWFIGRAMPIRDTQGEITRWFGTCTDIEDQRREGEKLESLVAERTAKLQVQTKRLRRLAAELATAEQRERKRLAALLHDHLQQLLFATSMQLAQVSIQLEDEELSGSLDEAATRLSAAVEAARDLTRQLRPPALYEAGLVAALEWLATEMSDLHNLRVSLRTDGPEPLLSDDIKGLMFECARELLFNVVKYADVDRASIEVSQSGELVRLIVSDDGRGFDVEAATKDHHAGGFGLFSVRERLLALGGFVTIQSEPGRGSRVELAVPTLEPAAAAIGAPPEAVAATAAVGSDGRGAPRSELIRVLVVDDHAIVRQGLANLIDADARITVVGQAADGQRALEEVERLLPDLVLMDLNMPVMNGVEASREIRERWPATAIIGISVQGDETTAKAMREAGAMAFIPKSGDPQKLIETIVHVAARQRRLVGAAATELKR